MWRIAGRSNCVSRDWSLIFAEEGQIPHEAPDSGVPTAPGRNHTARIGIKISDGSVELFHKLDCNGLDSGDDEVIKKKQLHDLVSDVGFGFSGDGMCRRLFRLHWQESDRAISEMTPSGSFWISAVKRSS